MAEQKPRAFWAMREDRVLELASRSFGRSFTTKAEAVKALGALPVDKQHALKKRADPSAARRTRSAWAPAELRGGVVVPTADRLQHASQATLARYLRATTGLQAKSKAQALTLLHKFGPTEVARSADKAYAAIAHETGGRWRDSDIKTVGPPASSTATQTTLAGRSAAVASRTFRAVRRADRFGNWVQAGTAARQGYDKARENGADQTSAAVAGLRSAAVPLAFASAPMVAVVAGSGANRAIAAAKAASVGEAASKSPILKAGLNAIAGSANEVGAVLRGVQAVAKFAPLIGMTLAGVRGAGDDENRVRGFVRGAVTSFDPSGIVMSRGLVERGFDAMFGRSAESVKREASAGQRTRLAGEPTPAATVVARRAPAPLAADYKDTWTDSRGRTYHRRDTSVRTAGAA